MRTTNILVFCGLLAACGTENSSTPGDGGIDTGAGGEVTGSGGTAGAHGSGGTTGSGGAAGAQGTGGAAGAIGSGGHTGQWRIMPLGDSITGTTCYPQLLSKKLIAAGRTSFVFVGTNLNNQACGSGAPTVYTEGHGGYLATYLTTDSPPQGGRGKLSELQAWATAKPDVVLMELGTNDVWSSIATATILDAFSFIVEQFRSQNAAVIFFVAQITPLNPSGCTNCESRVEALNAQIPTWAATKATTASPIHVVDVWAALPAASYTPNSSYTSDGCHPNAAGAQLMADAWYAGITARGIP